jgi:hypothetical protein
MKNNSNQKKQNIAQITSLIYLEFFGPFGEVCANHTYMNESSDRVSD